MTSPLVQATQDIADSLGITLSKSQYLNHIAEQCDLHVQSVIGAAALLCANARSQRLTVQHINRVLQSENRPQLRGYDNVANFTMLTRPYEQTELYFTKETQLDLSKVAEKQIQPVGTRSYISEYLLTEGVPVCRQNLSTRRFLAKAPKVEKSVSIATTQPQDTSRRAPINIMKHTYNKNQTVGDVLHDSLQRYFVRLVNLLRDDTAFSKEFVLEKLSTDKGLQQLIPYMLQFIYGKMTTHYRDMNTMNALIDMTTAIVRNDHLGSEIYVHPLLKIAFSGLLGIDYTSIVQMDDTTLRNNAAQLLVLIVHKYRDEFSTIAGNVFNSLVSHLFDHQGSLSSHYGALAGIKAFGSEAIKRTLPHLISYCRMVKIEQRSTQEQQIFSLQNVKELLKQIAEVVRNSEKYNDEEKQMGKCLYDLVTKK